MFRDLVSPRSSAAAELEAITAERDFFKEKYAAHASEMEALKTQLKESQRMVDKLRNQVLDLSQQVMELEGSGGTGGEKKQVSSKRPSLAESNNSEHNTDNDNDSQQSRSNVLGEVATPPTNKKQDTKDENSEKENNGENEEVDSEEEGGSEGESDDDNDSHDDDEAEAIRLKASRMLAWASYQSTRRTPSKSIDDKDDGMATPDQPITRPSAAYTLPTKIQSLLDDDEDTDASSVVEQQQIASDSKVTAKGGKIGKFVSNLKDMMGTQSESDSDSSYEDDEESLDESLSESECSNLSENLARMQLDYRHADQDEH